jgi:hypothetical protein
MKKTTDNNQSHSKLYNADFPHREEEIMGNERVERNT